MVWYKKVFRDDEYAYYRGYDDIMGVCIYPKSSRCMH